jgi:hypothetical protein
MKMDSLLEVEMRLEQIMPLIREYLAAGKTVKFSPRGISMLPMLRQGIDDVVLSPIPEKLKKYDLPLYQRGDGHFVLHRIVRVGETYSCIGDNQFELEHGLRHDQMIALVTAFYRNGKYHSVNELTYRIYCRFWHYSRGLRHFWRRGIGWLRRHMR